MILEALVIFLIALAGGLLPLFFLWNERLLHGSLALATGIFLGAVFFHLLPAIAAAGPVTGPPESPAQEIARDPGSPGPDPLETLSLAPREEAGRDHADLTAWLFVLIGVLGVYLVESLVLRSRDHDDLHRHRAVSYSALVGLSFHSLTNGLAYPAVAEGPAWSNPVFIAIVSHKGLESFSLATVFQLAAFGRRGIVWIVTLFSLVTPLGILAGAVLVDRLKVGGATILSALAAGTFLYVCLGELLPEVFHHREDSLVKIGLMTLGIVSMLWMHGLGA